MNRYHRRKRNNHGNNGTNTSCFSYIWNAPLRIALPIIVFIVCVLPIIVVLQVSTADKIFQGGRIKAQINRANLRRQVPVEDKIVIVQIQEEAVRQAEESSLIHDMEEQLEEDLKKFRKQRGPALQRYENEYSMEKKLEKESRKKNSLVHIPGEENGSPGRQYEKEKLKASYEEKINAIKKDQEFRLHEIEEENKKKLDKEKKQMAKHIKQSLMKHRESLDESKSLHKVALESRKRLDASKNLLNYLCSLEDRELKILAKETGKRGYPYKKGMCLGSEGVESKLPLDYNNSKYFQVAVFEGHTISKRLTSYVFNHIADKSSGHHHLSSRFNEQHFNLPKKLTNNIPLDAFRDAAILIHPWLGAFYKVRVPLIMDDKRNSEAARDAAKGKNIYAYRKECYRRPWSNFNAKDVDTSISFKKSFNRFKDIFKQQASKFVNKYITHKDDDGPSGEEDLDNNDRNNNNKLGVVDTNGGKKSVISIVIMLHSSIRTNSLAKLYKQISSSKFKRAIHPFTARLIFVLCPFDKCKTKGKLLNELGENGAIVRNNDADLLSIVETQRYGDAWDWWFRGLQSGLAQIDDENEPIVLLDGHTSNIPVSLLMSVAKNVGQYQRVVFPLTYHLCPTHNWRSTYSNKKTAKSYNNISKTPYDAIENKIPGYLQKRVINIAFTKKDGVKALNDIDPSSNDDDSDKENNIDDEKIGNKDNKNKDNNNNLDNTPILGSAVSACGRLMLAEYFYEKDHLNIHRNYLAGNNLQLHGWNRFIAEKAALQHAELAMKQNNQDFTASRIRQEVLAQKSNNVTAKTDVKLLTKGLKMLKNNSDVKKQLIASSEELKAKEQTSLPLTMLIPEVPFLGHKKCAMAADTMSYCEGGTCATEELAFLTIIDNKKDLSLLRCSAETLMNPSDGPGEQIENINDVQTYFHPDIGYEYSALIDHENVKFSWNLLKPDMHQ